MDIATAKQQIKNTIRIYLEKDALGHYRVPVVHQRPVFLQGPPGLGKTAVMQQIADEMNIGLVSYSMTHHTRQSALGLPVIVEKEFDGFTYQVSEYTMSEILASVYECMEKTGKREGILFLDEINCVSETLSPSMLLFLQYKVFGGHQVPPGWVVVTAGNPARFNKSAHEFDAATRDRLKVMQIEPDLDAWKKYALESGIAGVIIHYLDIRREDFYKVRTEVNGMNVVTPRAWEDLSEIIQYSEELKIPVTEDLISQYLQDRETARNFALYYELYQKYRATYRIQELLSGSWDEETLESARSERADERITLTGLMLESVCRSMADCLLRHDALLLAAEYLKGGRERIAASADVQSALAAMEEKMEKKAVDPQTGAVHAAGRPAYELLRMLRGWREECGEKSGGPFALIRDAYRKEVAELKQEVATTQSQIRCMFDFLEAAFGQGMELSMAVNDLSRTPDAVSFIGQFLSREYFEKSRELLLAKQEGRILDQLELFM